MTTPTAKDFVTQAQAAKIALANKPQQSLLAEAIDLAAQKANLAHLDGARRHLQDAEELLEEAFLEILQDPATLALIKQLVRSDEILNLIEKKAALIAIVEQNGNTPTPTS